MYIHLFIDRIGFQHTFQIDKKKKHTHTHIYYNVGRLEIIISIAYKYNIYPASKNTIQKKKANLLMDSRQVKCVCVFVYANQNKLF